MANKERREQLIASMQQLGQVGDDWISNLKEAKCPLCGKEINEAEFRDELSKQEFELSHLCQSCQDGVFKDE